MKWVILLMLAPLAANAQKIIWVDKNAIHPIVTSDTASAGYMFDGYLPVPVENRDSFMAYIYFIGTLLRDKRLQSKTTVTLKTGNTTFVINPLSGFSSPRYQITVNTFVNHLQMAVLLVDGAVPHTMNIRLHNAFLRYLEVSPYFQIPYKQIVPVFAPLETGN